MAMADIFSIVNDELLQAWMAISSKVQGDTIDSSDKRCFTPRMRDDAHSPRKCLDDGRKQRSLSNNAALPCSSMSSSIIGDGEEDGNGAAGSCACCGASYVHLQRARCE